MRGEGGKPSKGRNSTLGSSPHARGGPGWRGPGSSARGLIPACAGRAAQPVSTAVVTAAHPRMRGEGRGRGDGQDHHRGSSPHARGGRFRASAGAPVVRLIPACAGRATCPCRDGLRSWAHPRMRGEGEPPGGVGGGGLGSSPHARGGRGACKRWSSSEGLIPACAGRAAKAKTALLTRQAHPRMRGEGGPSHTPRRAHGGSSPHARGGLPPVQTGEHDMGLIPACAGRAPIWARAWTFSRAHPRMRGEGALASSWSRFSFGSSPHARGGLTRANA